MRYVTNAIALLAVAGFWSLIGSASYAATAQEALEGCENFPDSTAPRLCEAYFVEIIMFLGSDDRMVNPNGPLCLGEDLTTADVIPIVVDWIKEHPGQRSIDVFDAAHSALSPQFRC